MFSAVSVILFLGFSLAPSLIHGGRIIGGEEIPIEDVPYQISLEIEGSHQCGGSIIAPNFVITAAHCTFQSSEEYLAVRAGTSTRGSGGQLVNVTKNNVHPEWDIFTVDYDFAILELAEDLAFGDTIKAIDLPSRSQSLPAGTEVLVSGWGLLSVTSTALPVNLQAVTIELYDQETCNNDYPGAITERMFCAGVAEGGKAPCSADSGGPLQASGTLLGVVSWSSGCSEDELASVFTNVTVLLDYVEEITGITVK